MVLTFVFLVLASVANGDYLSITLSSSSLTAGTTFTATVTKKDSSNALLLDGTTVYLYSSSGFLLGSNSIDFSGPASSATSGNLYFTVSGTYSVYAVCAGFTQASASITVNADSSDLRLTFTTQPVSGSGSSNCPPVVVKACDKYGNLISSGSATVYLSLDSTSGAMAVKSVAMSSGVASFSSCSISGAGTFRFVASAASYGSVLSSSFTVSETLSAIVITAPTETCYAGNTCYVQVTLTNSNSKTYFSSGASITVSKSSGSGTVTSSAFTPSKDVNSVSVVFSVGGTYVLTASCTGCTGSPTPTTASVTVLSNAYIHVKCPVEAKAGTSTTYQVGLNGVAPSGTVTVTLSSTDITMVTTSLTFTAVDTYQDVQITIPYFTSSTYTYSATITHSFSASGTNYASATFTGCGMASGGSMTLPVYTDNPTVTVDSQLTIESLSSGTYQISLNIPPKSLTVTINITPGTGLTVSPTSVAFTTSSWSAKSIKVTSTSSVTSVSTTSTITHAISTTDTFYTSPVKVPSNLQTSVTIVMSSFAGIVFSNDYLNIAYLESSTYTVKLKTQPSNSVTIAITSSLASVTVSPSSLTFTTSNYGTAQTVTVTLSTAASSLTSLDYKSTLTHTASSSDSMYSGLIYETTAELINTCEAAVYDWFTSNTCSATITNFQITSSKPVRCSPGNYYSGTTCQTCPSGSSCLDGKTSSTCPLGHYTSTTGKSYCSPVSAGNYYSSTTSTGTAVASGKFSLPRAQSASYVYTCQTGNMCPYTTIDASYKCPLGKYSAAQATSCTSCPAGSSCTYAAATGCPNSNDYSPVDRNECFKCSSVFTVCTSTSITVIPNGKKLSGGVITTCATNKYCSISNNFQESTCPLGTYISGSSCIPCTTSTTTSYKCDGTGTSISTTTCSSPTYSWGLFCLTCPWPLHTSSGSCLSISSGKESSTLTGETDCAAFYWSPGGYQTCTPCSPGYQCNIGSAKPTSNICTTANICTPGSTAAVTTWTAGLYNDETGTSDLNQLKVCLPGYKCPAASVASTTTCNQYEFCPMGSKDTYTFYCRGGTYSSAASTIGVWADCTLSTLASGQYSQSGNNNAATAGYFSADMLSLSGCPYGTYANAGKYDVTQCTACSTYGFCPRQSALPTLCPLGFTINGSGTSSCYRCSSGTMCVGSNLAASSACTAGHFCIRGTYYNSYKMIPGYYITVTNAVSEKSAIECSAGSACAAGATSLTGSCTSNYYCPAGVLMSKMFACPAGTFNTITNAATSSSPDCGACTAGSACMAGTGVIACPAGFYCPASTENPNQFACPGGKFRTTTGGTDLTGCTDCATGKYCPIASTQQYSCPHGTYRGTIGAEKLSDCVSCTSGKYCDTSGGTTTPTDCGIGYYCDLGATAPLPCERGYYCDLTTMTSTDMYLKKCTAGYLCPFGVSVIPSSDVNTYGCALGYYCPYGKFYSIPCRPGTYVNVRASDDILDCIKASAGKYLDTFAATADGTACPAGYYCPLGTTQPVACPAGTYNAATGKSALAECLVCPAGKYCPYESMTTPISCPQGSYCVSGVTSPTLCPERTYGAAADLTKLADCLDCPAGKYCDAAGLTTPTGNCAAGYYCEKRQKTATPDGDTYGYLCPAGKYCPAGCTTPSSCPAGTFNNYEGQIDATGCIKCPEGFYCLNAVDPYPTGPCGDGYYCVLEETSSAPTGKAAIAGYFAPGGTPDDISCPIGTYQPDTGKKECITCDAGYYCPNMGMSTKTDCPVGTYCPAGCVDPIPCPPGTFRATTLAQSLSDCTLCTAGKYCADYKLSVESGDCGAGFFCELGSPYKYPKDLTDTTNEKYGPCPKGYFCQSGTTSRTANPCVAGTYNPAEKGESSSSCLKCTAGRYCAGTANTNDNSVCPEQYFCPESTTTSNANPCTAGNFCAAGSDYEKPCFPGTFSNAAQAISCTTCTAGHYCVRQTNIIDSTNECPAGYYCPAGTYYNKQYACPPGTYLDLTAKTQLSDCKDCTAGKYCEIYGVSDLSSRDCAAGFYCKVKAKQSKPMDDSTYGGSCKRGEYCPSGSSAATSCDAGKYCDKDQLAGVTGDCLAGHYCTLKATVKNPSNAIFTFGDVCPTGKYCPTGTGTPIDCPIGTYMPYTGAQALADCIECPPGYVCGTTGITFPTTKCPAGYVCASGVSVGTTTPCSAGKYCPEGSHEQIKCPAGTYQPNTASSTCLDCTAGNYCEEGATTQTACPAGYYCLAKTGYRYSYPCSPGTYNPSTGKSLLSDCILCDPGKYCGTEGLSAVTADCAAGYYCTSGSKVSSPPDSHTSGSVCERGNFCPAGSNTQTSCTAGSYCIKQGLGAVSAACESGYYCLAGSITPVPTDGVSGNICPAGKYCISGSATSADCPAGTFGAGVGLILQTSCTDCTPGYYCATSGLTAPTNKCSAGYYCDTKASSATASACTAGNYCPEGSPKEIPCELGYFQSAAAQSSCQDCTAGFYCPTGSATGISCQVGYSCPTGTRHSTEFPCESGKFASTTGKAACDKCPAGQYCPVGSQNSNLDCPLYSYCPEETGIPFICPLGRYNSDPGSLKLQSSTSCTACPAGKYCVDGRISEDCVAGFLCIGGSHTPTPFGTYTYGQDCPSGGYCEKGTTALTSCPSGKFNKLRGGKSINDCTDCPPGYYCDPKVSTPIECPAGSYCPQGVQEHTLCPIRTYNSETKQDSQNSCKVCPGGYMCTQKGTADYTKYECGKIGAYCVEGAQTQTPCPPGTYSNSTTAASVDDCLVCTEGFMCPGGSDLMLSCREGTYCPAGSAYPKLCLVGHYCPKESAQSIKCPRGFYCPKYDYANLPSYVQTEGLYYNTTHVDGKSYIECPKGYACPEGSFAPEFCQDGYYASNNECLPCGQGNYSNSTEGCKRCDPGFICVKAATRPDPMDNETQGGYICPSGYYCEAGAFSPAPCKPGTYNPLKGQSSENVCLLCPKDSYTDTFGNPTCLPCGSSASTGIGSTTCTCTGANRNYLKSDGTCRCIPGYEFISEGVLISDQDGTEDCFKKVYVFQPKGQVRDPSGTPKAEDDCKSECDGGKGTRMNGVGICQCETVKSVDDICNKGCRDDAEKFTIVGSQIISSKTQESLSLDKIEGYYGKVSCSGGCTLYSLDMSDDGPQAMYGPGTALNTLLNRRRSLAESSPISNPVICISLNDTYIFSISKDHYPEYLKDSLINTNEDFDYGAFQELKTLMKSDSANITTFAFTFSEQGIYDFVDSSSSDKHVIISVMGAGQQCTDPEIPIRTRTVSSVLTMGTQSRKNIISDPDWTFIILTTICMIVIVVLLILAVYLFEHHRWTYRFRVTSNYRDLQLMMDFEALTKPENDSSSFDESGKEEDSSKKSNIDANVGVDEMVGNDDIDPTIFNHMQKLLEDQKVLAENTFHSRLEDGRKNMSDMLDKISKIKKFLRDSLEGLDDGEGSEEQEQEVSPEQEVENILSQLADSYLRDSTRLDDAKRKFQEILQDPNLSDKDKKDLLQDFSANMLRLDQALVDEQNKANELLSKRLQDRANRKKKQSPSIFPIAEEPASSFVSTIAKKTADKEVDNVDQARAELVQSLEDEKSAQIKKMREELSRNLKDAKSKREQDELMENYNRNAKELEIRMQEEREKQEAELMKRLKNRKIKQPPPLVEVEPSVEHQENSEDAPDLPKFFKVEDQEKIEILRTKQDVVRQELFEKQEMEKIKLDEEFNDLALNIPKDDQRHQLEAALKTASDAEKKQLLAQMDLLNSKPDSSKQKESLQAKLEERKRLRALKEAELRKKHQAEQSRLDDKQDDEVADMTTKITQEKILKLMSSDLDPEELTRKIKEMIDEKHQIELDQLLRKKQENLTQRQTDLLQDSISSKADKLMKIRHEFVVKRNQVELSALSPMAKAAEIKSLEKQETDAVTQLDYNFVNNLGKDQDGLWRSVEDEFRQRFLDLSDKQLQETAELLKKMRELNPALLQSHLNQAEADAEGLKKQVESDYNKKLKELDSRQLEFLKIQGGVEQEIDEIRKQLDEAEARKREMFEVERMRKEKEEKQRQMLEEMRRRGIRPEQMEEMIKKHQQEMSEWEAAMEKERLRQKEKMQERLNARMQKYQEKMAQKLAKYKEDNNKVVQASKEEEKLEIKFPTGKNELIYEPVKQIDTKLRVNPLPVFVKHVVSEYADYINVLQTLLTRVKKIERLVASVDFEQFNMIMDQLEKISGELAVLKKR